MRVRPGHMVRSAVLLFAVAALAGLPNLAHAQFLNQAVGGISVNAEGVLTNSQVGDLAGLRQARLAAMGEIAEPLNLAAPMRKISLRYLEAKLAEHARTGAPLTDDLRYLAGMQRIQYVFVVPERQDIILAGFGEGWTIAADGSVVGVTTGQPVLLLEDLVVAMGTAREAAKGGITCSIDPTREGLARLQQHQNQINAAGEPSEAMAMMEQALGPQSITVIGVPPTSHFARVLVAADYRMKRISMKFEDAPIKGLPSYLEMAPAGRAGLQAVAPRFWLATHYEPMLTDLEGLTWELRGAGVKCMTEDEMVAADGTRKQTGKANRVAQKWADLMTAKYAELSKREPIFGDLRNIMDLAVVSALIVKEDLAARAGGLSLPTLTTSKELQGESYFVPKQIDSKASVVKKGSNWMISASGGVQINSWGVADRKESSSELTSVRKQSLSQDGKNWWWN